MGADVDWYLPSRIDDGYGLALATVERLAARGTQLLVTVDCAITAVEEVAAARAAGMDVVVTDHHAPRADGRLPDAPIVHPRIGGYPCPELCAAGVAHLLARALLEAAGTDPAAADADLDLVALATVADCVPLVDENRRLVRAGLRALASTRKAGLQALMQVARVDPSGVDASAIGFRLAPRINAAGRLHRADAGLELLLTTDLERARAVAAELDAINVERRDVETRILFEAEAQVAEARAAGAEPAAYVLAADGWHPGVIGIVASRIAERHHRPAVLIALDGDEGTGSGRSIPAFDLLGGLEAASADLLRHGGHRAAAGLTIARGRVEAFRAAFVTHAAATLTAEDLVPVQRVDAVVPGDALHLPLAEELQRLAPFGMANPEPTLLVPSALLDDPRGMGEGRHVSFTLAAGGARSRCVAFGRGSSLPAAPGEPVDAAVRLEVNRYNGAVEPRLVLRHARPARPEPIRVVGEPPFAEALAAELARDLSASGSPPGRRMPAPRRASTTCAASRTASRCRTPARSATSAAAASPASSATSRPAARRCSRSPRTRGTAPARSPTASAASRSPRGRRWRPIPAWRRSSPTSWRSTRRRTRSSSALAEHLPGDGWTHLAWGDAEVELARRVLTWELDLRAPLADPIRGSAPLRRPGAGAAPRRQAPRARARRRGARGAAARQRAAAAVRGARRPAAARAGRARPDRAERAPLAVAVPPPAVRTELERSAAFRAYAARLADGFAQLDAPDRAPAPAPRAPAAVAAA